MRVLSVGNMYPPHHLGGYELLWRSGVAHLREAGHEVRVLTTDHREPGRAGAPEEHDGVHRELRWYWHDHRFPRIGPAGRLALERHNGAVLARHLDELSPDVVNWWAMGGMSMSLLERVRKAGLPAVGVVIDDWLSYGPQVDAWSRAFGRRPRLAALAERTTGIPTRVDLGACARWLFASEALRRRATAGTLLPRTELAHPGIDLDFFREDAPRPWRWRLLYLGRIDERKGIDTAIRALARLPGDATLTVHGTGDERHLRELHALVEAEGLEGRVTFTCGPRDQVPRAYADADAVLFPVRWEEPWGLVPLEAMAVGRPVVATATGGSAEYLRDEENCLVFRPPDDPATLAGAVFRLAGDDRLRERLREGGLATAARFPEAACNRQIEAALLEAAGQPAPAAA